MKNKIDSPAAHTPTPWFFDVQEPIPASFGQKYEITSNAHGHGIWTAYTQNKEDAAFIVRAVNAHEELLSLLKEARNRMIGSAPAIRSLSERTDKAITRAEGR